MLATIIIDENEQRSMPMAGSATLDRYRSLMELWGGLVSSHRIGRKEKNKKKEREKKLGNQGAEISIDSIYKWTSGMQAALLIRRDRRDKQRLRGGKIGRELPSNFATRLIPPLPRYPPRSYIYGVSIKSSRPSKKRSWSLRINSIN